MRASLVGLEIQSVYGASFVCVKNTVTYVLDKYKWRYMYIYIIHRGLVVSVCRFLPRRDAHHSGAMAVPFGQSQHNSKLEGYYIERSPVSYVALWWCYHVLWCSNDMNSAWSYFEIFYCCTCAAVQYSSPALHLSHQHTKMKITKLTKCDG